jgi:quercetin dioxygenase-like cupin family protein
MRRNWMTEKGDVVDGHAHNFDHVTLVIKGSIHVKFTLPDGREGEHDFAAGEFVTIKAKVLHKITALEDDTLFYCVYAHRDPQGRVTQEYNGWLEAYH